jgi:hypothetical protein
MSCRILIFIAVLVALSPVALSQDALDSLDDAIVDVTESSVGELLSEVRVLKAENSALLKEMVELKAALEVLRVESEGKQSESALALEEENSRLRKSLRLVYGGRVENLPNVPMPNRDLLVEILSEGQLGVQYEKQLDVLEDVSEQPVEPVFSIVKEWGRSPEVVAEMGGNLSTLKGISIVVTPGTSREALVAYGLKLHDAYKDYDNLNIEAFDRRESADVFASKGTIDFPFRVLSISKHSKSERDVVLVGRGRTLEEIR